jgi:hypothetical protein
MLFNDPREPRLSQIRNEKLTPTVYTPKGRQGYKKWHIRPT